MTKRNAPTLLIDGDILLYESSSACEQEIDWGEDLWTLHSDFKEVRNLLKKKVEALKKELKSPNIIFCISDDANFRKTVLPSYKAKRKTVRKPLAYKALKAWVQEEYPSALYPTLEADDVCGILATSNSNHIVVSEDKDLKTIPCTLYRQGEILEYSPIDADYWFLYQTLCGDVTDGYKGCPGIGDKTAQKILTTDFDPETYNMKDMWKRVVSAYVKAGLTEQDALTQARCARILRNTDWDSEKQRVKLWTP